MDEFCEGSKCDPWIVQALSLDLPQTNAEVTAAAHAANTACSMKTSVQPPHNVATSAS